MVQKNANELPFRDGSRNTSPSFGLWTWFYLKWLSRGDTWKYHSNWGADWQKDYFQRCCKRRQAGREYSKYWGVCLPAEIIHRRTWSHLVDPWDLKPSGLSLKRYWQQKALLFMIMTTRTLSVKPTGWAVLHEKMTTESIIPCKIEVRGPVRVTQPKFRKNMIMMVKVYNDDDMGMINMTVLEW